MVVVEPDDPGVDRIGWARIALPQIGGGGEVPAVRAAVFALDVRGDNVRVAGRDEAEFFEISQGVLHRSFLQSVVVDQGFDGWERGAAIDIGVIRQPDEQRWRDLTSFRSVEIGAWLRA